MEWHTDAASLHTCDQSLTTIWGQQDDAVNQQHDVVDVALGFAIGSDDGCPQPRLWNGCNAGSRFFVAPSGAVHTSVPTILPAPDMFTRLGSAFRVNDGGATALAQLHAVAPLPCADREAGVRDGRSGHRCKQGNPRSGQTFFLRGNCGAAHNETAS